MRRDTLQSNKNLIGTIFAALLFFAIAYRFPVKEGEVRVSFMVIMEIALTVSLSVVIWYYSKPLALFLIMSMVSMFYPVYGPHSFYAQKMVFLGCLWFFLIVHFVNDVDPIMDALCYGAIINLIVQCFQSIFMTLDLPFWLTSGEPTGLMANPNEIAALYIFCLMAFFRKKWFTGIRLAWIPLIVGGIIISHSKMAIVCLAFGFMIWLFYQTMYGKEYNHIRYLMLIFMVILMGWFILCVPIPSLYLRFKVWMYTLPILAKHWVIGAGIGHWKVLFKGAMPFDGCRWDMAHNDIYQMWAEMGVIPLLLLAWYFFDIINRFKKEAILTYIAIGMITINACGNFPFHIAPLAMIALTWMAILEIQTRGNLCSQKIL